jgi:NTE family protein
MATSVPVAPRETALVLAGAFSRGAYSAGALQTIAERDLPIARIVATSAGALNAVVYAAGLRAGRAREATAALAELWSESSWRAVLDPDLSDLTSGRGLSSLANLRRLLREHTERWLPGEGRPIDLQLVLTATQGDPEVKRREHATSFESVVRFDGSAFDHPESRERLYLAATAAAAFPGVYAPVDVPGIGPCIDGGAVNNNPIRQALEANPRIDRVLLVTHNPKLFTPPPFQGLRFGEHVLEIVANERLYRDLREAATVHARLSDLRALHARGVLDAGQLEEVERAVGLAGARFVEIVEVRPEEPLAGSAITGFFSRAIRTSFVEAGRRAARRALDASPAESPPAAGPQHAAPTPSR